MWCSMIRAHLVAAITRTLTGPAGTADWHNFALLRHAEKLGLPRERHAADRIQANRATIDLFEPFPVATNGRGKGPCGTSRRPWIAAKARPSAQSGLLRWWCPCSWS